MSFSGARRGSGTNLDEQRTGDQSNVGDQAQDASAPEKPENAVVDGEREASSLLARLFSPLFLAFLPLTFDRPPNALQTRRDFAVEEPRVVLSSFSLALFEGTSDPLRDSAGGAIILQLVEISGFERTGVSESHEGADPFESEDA